MSENKTIHIATNLHPPLIEKYRQIKNHFEKEMGIDLSDSDILRFLVNFYHRTINEE